MPPTSTSPVPTKTNLVTAYRVVAGLLVVFVIVQAVMAGQIIYEGELQTLHGILGNVSFLLAVASVVLALVSRAPKAAVGVAAVLVVLTTIQIGLGYSAGPESPQAGAWHIPNGVAIFGLALYQQVLVRRLATAEV